MTVKSSPPLEQVRPLIQVRQMRDSTAEPVLSAELDAIADVARWSGSATRSCSQSAGRDHEKRASLLRLAAPATVLA
jgi:hypothetical protein